MWLNSAAQRRVYYTVDIYISYSYKYITLCIIDGATWINCSEASAYHFIYNIYINIYIYACKIDDNNHNHDSDIEYSFNI